MTQKNNILYTKSWGPNAFTGYTEYRYGAKIPINNGKPIFNHDATRSMVAKVVLYLEQFHRTPFEFEGACRHHIRSGLCLVGYEWSIADREAARIVSLALGKMHARRPTWEEGQRQYVMPRENCYRCERPLDDEQIARSERFCSSMCASAHIEQRDYVGHIYENKVATLAFRAVLKSKRPLVKCGYCSKKFRANSPGGTWEFCSHSCSSKAKMKRAILDLPKRDCPACSSTFAPSSPQQVFCTSQCRGRIQAVKKRIREGEFNGLRPMVFDYFIGQELQRPNLTLPKLDFML